MEDKVPNIDQLEEVGLYRLLNETELTFISGPHHIDNPGPAYPYYYFIEDKGKTIELFLRSLPDSIMMSDKTPKNNENCLDDITNPIHIHIGSFVKENNANIYYKEVNNNTLYHGNIISKDLKATDYSYLCEPLEKYHEDFFGPDS